MNKSDNLYEKILLEKLKEGDENAFSIIFSTYYKDLIFFAFTYLKDVDTSEEIVQDAFVRLWENRNGIVINTSLKSYLLRTVQNKSIDWLRHLKIRNKYYADIIDNAILFDNDTENYVLKSELEHQIEKALIKLPADIAQAFNMNRNEGLKYHEIAQKLNVSVRTIEVRIGKALYLLKEQLKDYLFVLFILILLFSLMH